VKKALDNTVLAYNAEDHGAVSVSFGPQAVSAPTTLTKDVKVQNTGLSPVTYAVSFDDRTKVPGADYSVSPSSVTVGARSSKTVTVTLTLDPTQLTKTIDPTVDRAQGGLPRVYQADASGLLLLKSAGNPTINVPVYAAPRPASTMSQAASLTLPDGAQQSALMPLTGGGVDQGSGNKRITSLVAGFELSATSPALAVDFPDLGTADIRSVGVTSDTQQVTALSGDPLSTGLTYFAVQANHAWRTPVGIQEFDVLIDTDGDGHPDFVVFNTRLTGTDVLVAETVDLSDGSVVDAEPLNNALGDTDTALLQSNVMVLPVLTGALGLTGASSRIRYGVAGFTGYQSAPLDIVGADADGDNVSLGFDPLHPGAALFGTVTADTNPLLWLDNPTSTVKVTRDAAAYAADKAQGLMVVHFQNKEDSKVQTVTLNKLTSTTALALNPTTVVLGSSSTATVTVGGGAAGTPTGSVTLKDGAATVGTTALNPSGAAVFTVTPSSAGTHALTATYAGDDNYAGSSASGNLTVTATTPPPPTKVTPSVSLSLNKSSVKRGHKVKASVQVTGSAGTATGSVELGKVVNGVFKVVATGTLANGTVTLRFVPTKAGKYLLQARYGGDPAYTSATSREVKLKVTKL
jgi:Bacterial Ig-like domain (group 3)